MNIGAAMLICDKLDITIPSWDMALAGFTGLAHRMEWLGQCGNIQFINDSKATNGVAAAKALMSYRDIYWIVGGQMKQDGLGETMNALDHVRHAFVIGADTADCVNMLTPYVPVETCHTIEQATQTAFATAHDAQADQATILLSPAAASFDQFNSFEQRGDAFRDAVNHILLHASTKEHAHV
jgi:UDP-N-acetylmuramoylalanine--D-glutamate ligase